MNRAPQSPEQQSTAPAQVSPSCLQAMLHIPASQVPLQHSAEAPQTLPVGVHVGGSGAPASAAVSELRAPHPRPGAARAAQKTDESRT